MHFFPRTVIESLVRQHFFFGRIGHIRGMSHLLILFEAGFIFPVHFFTCGHAGSRRHRHLTHPYLEQRCFHSLGCLSVHQLQTAVFLAYQHERRSVGRNKSYSILCILYAHNCARRFRSPLPSSVSYGPHLP